MRRFEELKSRFRKKGGTRVRAGTTPRARVLVVVAGFLLGILLAGGPEYVSTQEPNADGDLRLVNVDTDAVEDPAVVAAVSGRLEIFDDPDGDGTGEWKGICDDRLGTLGKAEEGNVRVIGRQEARVACRQLGFSGGDPITELAIPSDFPGEPSQYYLLDELECSGSEDRILGDGKCYHLPRGENDCGHNEVFGVTCEPPTGNNDAVGYTAIRGTEPKTGVTVTADHSGITDADGKPTDASAFSYQWIRSDVFWNETIISGATASTYTLQEADEEEWIKVRIRFNDNAGNPEEVESFEVGPIYTNKPDGSLRLRPTISFTTGSNTVKMSANEQELLRTSFNVPVSSGEQSGDHEGLLQVFDEPSKRWKGVCDDNWDDRDASVACRQLGYSSGGTADTDIIWIGATLFFLLDEVGCEGTEGELLECDHAGRGVHNCASWEYAGVICGVD